METNECGQTPNNKPNLTIDPNGWSMTIALCCPLNIEGQQVFL